jgi:hypothetical protein
MEGRNKNRKKSKKRFESVCDEMRRNFEAAQPTRPTTI